MKLFKPFLYSIIIIGVFGSYKGMESERDFRRLDEQELHELQKFCGTPLIDEKWSELKISFGSEAKQGQFPWAVLHERYESGLGCTGTVISNYHILTAAHCFQGNKKKKEFEIKDYNVRKHTKVLAGTPCVFSDRLIKKGIDKYINCSRNEFKKPRILNVSSVIIPKESVAIMQKCFREEVHYDESELSDLAIVELSEPLELNDIDIRPICLPKPGTKIPNTVEFCGYGMIDQRNEAFNQQLFWESEDGYNLSPSGRIINVTHNHRSDVSICDGDSGGGLTASINARNYIFGITSTSECYCDGVVPPYNTHFFNVLTKHDFICYYTGICPLGYNKYIDPNYPNHPEEVAYLNNGDGKTLIGPEDTRPMEQFCEDLYAHCVKGPEHCNLESYKNYICVKTCNDDCYMGSPFGLQLPRVATRKNSAKANVPKGHLY